MLKPIKEYTNVFSRLKLENTLGANGVIVSLVEGWGVERLEGMVQSLLAEKTGRIRRGLRVPINSSLLPLVWNVKCVAFLNKRIYTVFFCYGLLNFSKLKTNSNCSIFMQLFSIWLQFQFSFY